MHACHGIGVYNGIKKVSSVFLASMRVVIFLGQNRAKSKEKKLILEDRQGGKTQLITCTKIAIYLGHSTSSLPIERLPIPVINRGHICP
jgi:hypothetical protein